MFPPSHLFVIPLQHDDLVLQGLVLALQVHSGQVHVIQHLPQSSDVCLHRQSHGQLVLEPGKFTFQPGIFPQTGQLREKGRREGAHFILKSSAASFALSMSRTALALSLEAIQICREQKKAKIVYI